jgi:putative ABC transport system permease protein
MNRLWSKLCFVFRRERFDRDLAEEIQQHVERKAAKLMESGVAPDDAHSAAQRQFGNALSLRERSCDLWTWVWLETLVQDVRYGARMLRKNPGFASVAVLTLALGIAVNTTIFSVISGWLLKPPPVPHPDRVVMVVSTNAARALDLGQVSAADFRMWRAESHAFTDLAAVDPDTDFTLTGGGEPEHLDGLRVSANYFDVLGVRPMLGRGFLPGEEQPGRDHVMVLSYGLWQRRFAADRNVIGKTVTLNGESYVVTGVMPVEFRLYTFHEQMWMPLVLHATELAPKARDERSLVVYGRLKSGIGIEQARAEMAALAVHAERSYPASEKGWGANVMTLQQYTIERMHIRAGLSILMAAVVMVLLIACANIANLLLARGAAREQEIAVRIAMGAGRMRVTRQLLVESLLIAALGGGAGLLLAFWGVNVLRGMLTFNPYVASLSADVAVDYRVLMFTCLASVGAALLFGLAPAIRVSASDPQNTLRQGGRTGNLRRGWGRNILVGAQIALAMLLAIGASLMVQATSEEMGGDYGYDPGRVAVVELSLSGPRYQDASRRMAFAGEVLEKLQAVPGVEAVAAAAYGIPFDSGKTTFRIQGHPTLPAADRPKARYFGVTPDYFRVLGVALMQGRNFSVSDAGNAPPVAIINRAFAQRYFAGQQPIGRHISVDRDQDGPPVWHEIVGVVPDIRASFGARREEDPQIYEPYLESPAAGVKCLVRVARNPSTLGPALRRAVWSVDADQPIGDIATIAARVTRMDTGDFIADGLLVLFGAMAMVLAAIGIYGVIAYAVAQRTHEIGIRMALGARRSNVLVMIVSRGMLLAVVSAGIGLAAASALPGLFASMFEGWRVHPAAIFTIVPLVLLSAVLLAICIPAWRAARVHPMEALRYE